MRDGLALIEMVVRSILKHWLTVIILWGLGSALVIGYAVSLPNLYEAKAVVTKRESDGSSLERLAGQYSQLASMAGLNIGGLAPVGGDSQKSTLALQKVKSLSFFSEYIYPRYLRDIMATLRWDDESRESMYDPAIYNEASDEWVREVSLPRTKKPSAQESHLKFLQMLSINSDPQSGFVTLTVIHESPIVAQRLASDILELISESMRNSDTQQANKAIHFLRERIRENRVVELDNMFAQLIEEQIKTIMLANAAENYVFRVIDPPVEAEFKAAPKRSVLVLIGSVFSLFFSVVIVSLRAILSMSAPMPERES